MQLMTRSEAIAAGVTQYFTGKPCKYGHVAYRYTQSGSCSACVSDAARDTRRLAGIPERANALREQRRAEAAEAATRARDEYRRAMRSLVEIRIPVHAEHVETIFETSIGFCLAAFPMLKRADVEPGRQPIRGTPLYRVLVPSELVELMRETANCLWSTVRPNFANVEKVRAELIAEIEKDGEAPEGWK